MANWYGNASPEVRRAINQSFYNSGRVSNSTPKRELYRSDKYIYYSDGTKQSW